MSAGARHRLHSEIVLPPSEKELTMRRPVLLVAVPALVAAVVAVGAAPSDAARSSSTDAVPVSGGKPTLALLPAADPESQWLANDLAMHPWLTQHVSTSRPLDADEARQADWIVRIAVSTNVLPNKAVASTYLYRPDQPNRRLVGMANATSVVGLRTELDGLRGLIGSALGLDDGSSGSAPDTSGITPTPKPDPRDLRPVRPR
jgi:hypothetical protein